MMNRLNIWLGQQEPLTRKFWILLTCLLGSLFFLLFQGGKTAFMIFIIVSILCIYLGLGRWSGISSAHGSRTLLNKSLSGELESGSSLHVQLQVHIPGFWPIPYVIVKDKLKRKNEKDSSFEATFVPDWKRRGEVTYKTPALERGFYQFGATVCSTEDIFGLFQHKGKMELNKSFRVLPKMVHINEWNQFNKMIKGAHHHSAITRASRETTQINGIRDYVYGDRISRIHWKTTARTGTWKSKEFERESLPKTLIVLDRNRAAYQDKGQFERAVSVAASLYRFGFKRDLSLGILSVGKDFNLFEPKRGFDQQKMVMNHLIEVDFDGEHDINHVMKNHASAFSQSMFVLLITPQSEESVIIKSMNLLKQVQVVLCHMWITPNDNENQATEWSKILRSRGYYGYAIRTLNELPHLLGGRVI